VNAGTISSFVCKAIVNLSVVVLMHNKLPSQTKSNVLFVAGCIVSDFYKKIK